MRHSLLVVIALASACGGGAGPSGAAAFVGTWARAGSAVETCPGLSPATYPLKGDLTIALGSGADTVVATAPNGCTTTYTVAATVASQLAGQSCTTTVNGVPQTSTEQTHTLTLGSDGNTLTEASQGQIVEMTSSGDVTCASESSGTFTRQ